LFDPSLSSLVIKAKLGKKKKTDLVQFSGWLICLDKEFLLEGPATKK
jgi:hypothetical protein